MAAILQMTFSNVFSSMKSVLYFDSSFMEVCSKGQIYNKSALVQIMASRQTGDKPLPEPMLTSFTDAYMRYSGEMS